MDDGSQNGGADADFDGIGAYQFNALDDGAEGAGIGQDAKNRMEKMNMTPVAATEPMPLEPVIMSPKDLKLAKSSQHPAFPPRRPPARPR